ncbi:MAG: two-component regulator propeller domain-containing protein, partial [Rhodocyclaceae bacterium]
MAHQPRSLRCLRALCATLAMFAGLLHPTDEALASEHPDLRFERVAGLEADNPSAFLQDRQGFVWTASSTGLYRHDGYRTIHYRHNATVPGSLPSNSAQALFEDKNGRIWVGTHSGLVRFEAQSGQFTLFAPPPSSDGNLQNRLTRDITGDGHDGMWLATRAGLLHFNPGNQQFTSYRHDPARTGSLPSDNVSVLARDAREGLWVATWPTGLAYLSKGSTQFERYQLDDASGTQKRQHNVRAMHVDQRQRLWIGTNSSLYLWQAGTPWASRKKLSPPPGSSNFRVFSIYEDSAGNIWIGTQQAGLLLWDDKQQTLVSYTHRTDDAHSLPNNAVSALLVDRTQTLWVGTQGGGISRSDLASNGIARILPQYIAPEHFKAGNLVFSISEDSPGKLWLGGVGGLALINLAERKLVRSLTHKLGQAEGLSSNEIFHLYRQANRTLWIATSAGLGRLDPDNGQLQTTFFEGRGNNSINKIAPGRDGILWLATAGGIIRYAPKEGSFQSFSHAPGDPYSLGPGSNSALLEDRAGNLWVGGGRESGARGLAVLERGSRQFQHYRHDPEDKNSLSSDIVTSIHEDARGDIWLGTPNGLNHATRATNGSIHFTRYATGSHISAIQSDLANNIWASTPSGLSKFDPKTGKTTNYTASAGRSEDTSIEGASFRGKDGTLYFGSINGFSIVKAQAIRENTNPPQVAITDISVFNQSLLGSPATADVTLEGAVTEPQRLKLAAKASVFSLEFSALHYADPARNRFAFRLDGFDHDWQERSAEHRIATYTNLDPGQYLFRLKAASKDGVWSASELQLPITITPPFWKKKSFQFMLMLCLIILVILIYNWRVRRLTQNQALLEKLVAERTSQLVDKERAKTRFLASASHDLRQPIQAITLFLGVLKHSGLKDEQKNTVRHLDASVAALRGLLDSLLDVSKLDAGAIVPHCQAISLNSLMEALTLELSPLALEKNLRFKFFCPHREITLNTDPQLLKVALLNLISNAINYTESGGLLFAARLRGEQVS